MVIIAIPIISILFSAGAISVLQRQREYLDEWIARAFHTGSSIQTVITLLSEAENGTRGYLLTREPGYLDSLRRAETDLPRRLAQLRGYVAGNTVQLARMDRIDVLTDQRVATLSASLAAADTQDLPRRLAEGQSLSTRIEREFAAMRAEEARMWLTRIAAERRLRERITLLIYGSTGASLLAGTLAMGLFLTGIVRRAQVLRENADRLVDGKPLLDLSGGADEIGGAAAALVRSGRLLVERETELRALNQELDRRVEERTRQLEKEIADRRESEEQLQQAQKMEAIGRLAGSIAHDFNNMLTVVIGFGESLAERVASDAEAKADLTEILQAANHTTSLTRQLLTFSRRQVVQPKILDLNAVVARMEGLLRLLGGEHIRIETVCPPMPERVFMDEGQLDQVIMNLAVNARDAMPNGGQLTIQTGPAQLDEAYTASHLGSPPGRYAMLVVRDNGCGMTPEVQARIFEPFFTTKEAGKGTGLGLSTVYGIVKQNGGNIWVYSEPGVGATFKIYLPVAVGTGEAAVPPETPEAPAKSAGTILIVDDDAAVRRVTSQILARRGYTVLEAEDAEAAARACRDFGGPIELLLTDVIMPRTNGRQLARKLGVAYPALKVLYMSGYSDEVIAFHSLLEPGNAFIEKPFTATAVAAKVREVLNEARGKDDQAEPPAR